ncbi:MAG: GTPase HflX [Rhabdochlamydiaceae bacterium]|nr:GTPase HflX [Rhabdochlamydiaceae bacterium]
MSQEFHLSDLKRAYLVGVHSSGRDKALCEEYLQELHRLCDSYGLPVVGQIACPIKKFDAGTYLGTGKIEEILQISIENQVDVVIFDDEISPHQQKNLEALLKRPVIDRTELILEVFAQRAQTKEAKLQIELARVKYQFPRLKRLWTHLSRQSSSGGGHVKGEGEKQIEIDRRLLRKRIERLKDEIEGIAANRQTQRIARKRSGIPTFAIVGYTNAGKSTLMRALTHENVLVEDRLFATLDTTTRKFSLPNKQEILLVDTVGFIRKIPHTLVASFKSTLEEAVFTDILLHLVDVSHPMAEEQAKATCEVLNELGAADRPIITVLNKIDACEDKSILMKFRAEYPRTVAISATTQEGVEELIDLMMQEVSKLRKVLNLQIPQSEYALVSQLLREGNIIHSEYEENDILLTVEIPFQIEHLVKKYERPKS